MVSEDAGLVGARYLELIGEPESHLIEQAGQRGTIGLGVVQLLRAALEQRDEFLALVRGWRRSAL